MPLNLEPCLTARLPVVKLIFPNTEVWMEHGASLASRHLPDERSSTPSFTSWRTCQLSPDQKSLHGMGPSTLKVLVPAMEANGVSFRK